MSIAAVVVVAAAVVAVVVATVVAVVVPLKAYRKWKNKVLLLPIVEFPFS